VWIDMVNANPWVVNIHQESGWQITASMTIRDCYLDGIGVANPPPVYPFENYPGSIVDTGWMVFEDPDQCPSFVSIEDQVGAYESLYCEDSPFEVYLGCDVPYWPDDPAWPVGLAECPPKLPYEDRVVWIAAFEAAGFAWVKDETWVEFTPGVSLADVIPPVCPVGACPEEEERPEIWNFEGAWETIPVGPELGSTDDDIRYGSWRRLPGLVVLADHGPGVRTVPPGKFDTEPAADYFDPLSPHEAYNLAGFFGTATYSLMGGTKETSIQAHVYVPRSLFTPIVLIDNVITIPTTDEYGVECVEGDALYRMDGGPLTCQPGGFSNHDAILGQTVVTVRVFMVDGVAPDVLVDQDNDGDVDIRDARYMGLDPVSNQQRFRFKVFHEDECGPYFDFDGNGEAATCVLPARPGDITRPPR
jgi:hypothetical protein